MDKTSQMYGTVRQRLGGDAIKDFDCCSLTLQPCVDPVVTPQGVLYEREAIYEHILKEKQRIAKELKKYAAQQAARATETKTKRKHEAAETARSFEDAECGILPVSKAPKGAGAETARDVERFDTMKGKAVAGVRAAGSALGHKSLLEGEDLNARAKDSCFWIPDVTPEWRDKDLAKPEDRVLCPFSGQPLRVKDLLTAVFTPLDTSRDVTVNNTSANERFMCPISRKTLSNAVACAVIRSGSVGHVVCMEAVEQVVKPDMADPFGKAGAKLAPKDIIPLQRGGTGFAGSGVRLEATKYNPAMLSY